MYYYEIKHDYLLIYHNDELIGKFLVELIDDIETFFYDFIEDLSDEVDL